MPGSRKSDDEETETEDLEDGPPGAVDEEEEDLEPAAESDEDDDTDLENVPATAAGRASAERLLDLFLEKKVLALHAKKPGKALVESVGRILESPLPVKQKASKMSDTLVDSDDVDDFFLDDEMLIEILKRW